MSVMRLQNYIDGQLVDPASDDWLDNYEPATGQVYSQVPDSSQQDIDRAVQAAIGAGAAWAGASPEERADVLFRVADGIDNHTEELVRLESQDNGKPQWLARSVDIPRCARNLRHFAATVIGQSSQSHPMPGAINYTLRQPLGVVGIISPWNLPLYLFTWKIAPASGEWELRDRKTIRGNPHDRLPFFADLS